jgi:hypothetical protein
VIPGRNKCAPDQICILVEIQFSFLIITVEKIPPTGAASKPHQFIGTRAIRFLIKADSANRKRKNCRKGGKLQTSRPTHFK